MLDGTYVRIEGRGRKVSERYQSMSEEKKKEWGRRVSGALKGKKRKPFTVEHRKNIGEAKKGEKSPNWQGGKSFEPYGIEFNEELRERIRERDNYACQVCGKVQRKRKFSVHHIDYDKKNNSMRNLVTLCRSCHGKTSCKRESWQLFFENEIKGIYKLRKVD